MDVFAAPWWLRLLAALGAVAVAWSAVAWVELRRAAPPAVVAAAAGDGQRSASIACTAGRPIARWRVTLDGVAVAGTAGDQGFAATLALPATRCELQVEADPGRPGPTALRVQVEAGAATIDRTVWADGLARITLLVPGARR
jgi:hypothetical protein